MCLFSIKKQPMTAKRDLVCYKSITIDNHPAIMLRSFKYKREKLNKISLKKTATSTQFFDSFAKKVNSIWGSFPSIITMGFYSVKRIQRLFVDEHYLTSNISPSKISKFIIPAGSKYYEDNSGLVVSNQIIYLEDIFNREMILDIMKNFKLYKTGIDGHRHYIGNPAYPSLKYLNSWKK